jgi:hypothetical protein
MNHKIVWHSFDGKLALTAENLVLIYKQGKWYHTDSPRWLHKVELMREAEATEQGIEQWKRYRRR